MPQVKCRICEVEFYAKPSWLRRGVGKYCSAKCQHEGQKKGKVVNCFICNKEVYKSLKNLKVSKSKKYFCTKSCQTIWRNTIVFVGSRHSNWKGGENTYRRLILRSGVSQLCRLCKTNDKRVLAVHHVDKNRKNNNLDNLIWLCHNCHFLIHHDIVEMKKLMEILV